MRLSSQLTGDLNPKWVSFAGKEPTLFPKELVSIASAARDPRRHSVLMTNGLKLSRSLLSDLSALIDCFDISVDGDEAFHDWMRGAGTFRRVWDRLPEVLAHTDSCIGLIATATNACLDEGRPQWEGIVGLARRLAREFSQQPRLSLSVSLYYGPPADPLRMTPETLTVFLQALRTVDFPTRILWTSSYDHLLPAVSAALGWSLDDLEYDLPTGLPLLCDGPMSVVLFSQSPTPQYALRVAVNGDVFLGCNHLSLSGEVKRFSVGNISKRPLRNIMSDVRNTSYGHYGAPHPSCLLCPDWTVCRGGDVQSGAYHAGVAHDPYCPILSHHT